MLFEVDEVPLELRLSKKLTILVVYNETTRGYDIPANQQAGYTSKTHEKGVSR
jgi:hypothetical protein